MSDDTKDERKHAYADFVAAHAEMKNAVLNKINPHFKSKYADLTAVREATTPALKKYGLAIIQYPTLNGEQFVLISRLIHRSGYVINESFFPLASNGTPQQVGSQITYARRYTWASLCGIAADEDDDANEGNGVGSIVPTKDYHKIANQINASILAANTIKELLDVWSDNMPEVREIKAKSERAYLALQDSYNKKAEALNNA